jgi:16S rRNA processing protein RimM
LKSSSSLNSRDDLVLVGRVVGAHGIRGSLKVHSYAESLSVYQTGEGVRVALPDGSVRTMIIEWVQPHGRVLLMAVEAVTDRSQAESLIGSELFVDKACLPALEEDTYYWFDLLGLRVYNTTGALLGHLEEVIPTPGNDIYVVKGKQNGQPRETLIPATGDVVLKVDLEGKTMIVDPPEGL